MRRIHETLSILLALILASASSSVAGDVHTSGKLVSAVPTGTPPLEVDSTTLVENLNANFLQGLEASDLLTGLGNVILVSPSGGHFTSIQAALDSITDAAIDNWYVVLVGPGVYNEILTLKPFVSVVGHGILETRIEVEGSGDVTAVVGSPAAILSDLSVSARSTDGDATALVNPFVVERARFEAVAAPAGVAIGIRVSGGTTRLVDTQVVALDGSVNVGLSVETSAFAQVFAQGGRIFSQSSGNPGATNYAVRQLAVGDAGELELVEVSLNVSAGGPSYGIRWEDGNVLLRRSRITGSSSVSITGVLMANLSLTMEDSEISWSGSASTRKGVEQVTGNSRIHGSRISALTGLEAGGSATINAAYSQVSGTISGAGTYNCIGLYSFSFSPVSCPP